jgi:hypothetical protein
MLPVRIAYALNILVLVPVVAATLFKVFAADQGRFAESSGWRILAGGHWLAILLLSIVGLFWPVRFAPVLIHQLIYKVTWLLYYALPQASRHEWNKIPLGMTISFIGIVLFWPFVIPWGQLFG